MTDHSDGPSDGEPVSDADDAGVTLNGVASKTGFDQGKMPADLNAERALLGGLLLANDRIDQFADYLKPVHFYEKLHERIYEQLLDMFRLGRTADPLSLNPRLEGDPGYEDIGGFEYLTRLVDEVPALYNLQEYAKVVFDCALRRNLVELGEQVSGRAREPRGRMDAEEQIEEVERALFDLSRVGKLDKGFQSFKSAVIDTLKNANEAYNRQGGLAGVSSGISDLDERLGGLQRSDLIIVAGRPGMGKTALATTIAYNIARAAAARPENEDGSPEEGAKVAFFSLEMSAEQLATRVISQRVGISSSAIRRGQLEEDEFYRLMDEAQTIEDTPLYIDDTGGISIAALAARARRLVMKEKIGLIIVDYLQLVTPSSSKNAGNRVQEISEVTQSLKALAKELDVPVMALSQLSRAVESREDKRPQLSDLRESGSIEQDADIVMFVYREAYYLEQAKPEEGSEKFSDWLQKMEHKRYAAEVIVGKHRHGPVGKVELYFDPKYTTFSNLEKRDTYN